MKLCETRCEILLSDLGFLLEQLLHLLVTWPLFLYAVNCFGEQSLYGYERNAILCKTYTASWTFSRMVNDIKNQSREA